MRKRCILGEKPAKNMCRIEEYRHKLGKEVKLRRPLAGSVLGHADDQLFQQSAGGKLAIAFQA